MTQARLLEILKGQAHGALPYSFPLLIGGRPAYNQRSDGITEDEHKAIRMKWATMSGDACYFDALLALAEG